MRGTLRVVVALLVLAAGFGAVVAGLFGLAAALGSIPSGRSSTALIGFAAYYRVVLAKGLAPQLIVCAVLLALLRRLALRLRRAAPRWNGLRHLLERRRPPMALLLAALAAYAPVAWLLARPLGSKLPALSMKGAGDQLGTAVLLTAGVVLAWLVAERIVGPATRKSDS